jgi:hypothetical protein
MYSPYPEADINIFYNLLFCDDLSLFHRDRSSETENVWSFLLAGQADEKSLLAIAEDEDQESRIRMLAFNRLRLAGYAVSPKILLGLIVEVPLEQGLDVLAAYADGSVRYIHQSGKVVVFEGNPTAVTPVALDLISSSQTLVNQIGPWTKKRLPPPVPGNVRMSFLVSDGLYFGEGPFAVLHNDSSGGPILAKAEVLLQIVVNTAIGMRVE